MKRIISERFALVTIGSILVFFTLFHILVMLGIIPFSIVWGGKLKSSREMLQLESASLAATVLMLLAVGIRGKMIRLRVSRLALRVVFGLMFLLFLLNTLGNATSASSLERLLFTPLTLVLALCCLRVCCGKGSDG